MVVFLQNQVCMCVCAHMCRVYPTHGHAGHKAQEDLRWNDESLSTLTFITCVLPCGLGFCFAIGNNRQILGQWWVVAATGQPYHRWCSPASLCLLILLSPLPWFLAPPANLTELPCMTSRPFPHSTRCSLNDCSFISSVPVSQKCSFLYKWCKGDQEVVVVFKLLIFPQF